MSIKQIPFMVYFPHEFRTIPSNPTFWWFSNQPSSAPSGCCSSSAVIQFSLSSRPNCFSILGSAPWSAPVQLETFQIRFEAFRTGILNMFIFVDICWENIYTYAIPIVLRSLSWVTVSAFATIKRSVQPSPNLHHTHISRPSEKRREQFNITPNSTSKNISLYSFSTT